MLTQSKLDPADRGRRRGLPGGRAVDEADPQGPGVAHRRPGRQPGGRHAVLQRRTTPQERYSAVDTHPARRRNIYLTTGTQLFSTEGNVDADHRGRHLRPPRHAGRRLRAGEQHGALRARQALHARLPRQLRARPSATTATCSLTKRDIAHNINFFMNVPVTPERRPHLRGRHLRARASTSRCAPRWTCSCLISNCPQLNNPCNAYNPTPVRLLIWD